MPGQHVGVAAEPRYHDEKIYEQPDKFEGFRYYNLREEGVSGQGMTDVDGKSWLLFGSGRHAW